MIGYVPWVQGQGLDTALCGKGGVCPGNAGLHGPITVLLLGSYEQCCLQAAVGLFKLVPSQTSAPRVESP